ncbi:MAG: ROK family transcriptional regulator [Actinomycetes bacterium]
MEITPGGAIPSLLREINERTVIDLLRVEGAMHAARIARHIGISKPTTSDILRSLVESGLVSELTPGEHDSHRAKNIFSAVSDIKISVAIDIGSRFIRAAVGDLNGVLRSEISLPNTSDSLISLLAIVETGVDQSLQTAGFSRGDIASIAVGTPGVIDQSTGNIEIAGTIGALDGVNLAAEIESLFKIPPIVENDINLLAVAEQVAGFGQGVSNFAVLSVGSGLGSGLVLNGKLHRGHSGAAGEVFYIPFGDPRDRQRTSTNPSGDRIAFVTRSLASAHPDSTLQEPYSTVDILNAAKAGDSLGQAVVALEADRIALYIAGISAVVDVELVVLAGGIGRQSKFFIQPIEALLKEILPYPPRLAVSELGDQGILIGALDLASAQACDRVFAERSKASS